MVNIAKGCQIHFYGFLCMQKLLIASIADHVLQYRKWARIPLTISNSYTFQGLGNHTSFSLM
jgi:hypothetical protein